ncbi:MAG: hypothetical protein ACFFCQ_09280 [Promethearchaeota archaeon]
MPLTAVLDTSFLVNIKRLQTLQYLCTAFSKVIITPEVWKESYQFHSQLEELPCIKVINLSSEETNEVNSLHDEFTERFSGKHIGEIETLVVAQSRNCFLVISDNFAPWYIRERHYKYSKVEIYRGIYYFTRLIEIGILTKNVLEMLEGTYSQKEIQRMKEKMK